ncbi:Asp23/Gls24 family envelope stress response protein [Salimicrobium sp. PL1-032A]|uniref:Asp23/Gls24 family envelope stress response protein n=1 Tax=Salimicrobium sp. PL1-032A TaxID=3095364 RepID=UPI003261CA39
MDDQLVNVSESSALGAIEIAPEVIEVIAGIAVSEVSGVADMRGNFATGVAEKLGKKSRGKGVKVDLMEEGVVIEAYVVMDYGISIPEAAGAIQDNTRQALENMTNLTVKEVNVHVVGVQIEGKEADTGD